MRSGPKARVRTEAESRTAGGAPMRLDRLLPLSTPARQPERQDERPPRRPPDPPETSGRRDPPSDEQDADRGDRPTPPDHLDITV